MCRWQSLERFVQGYYFAGNKTGYKQANDPIAWDIVSTKTNKSWMQLFSMLKDLIKYTDELVFVFDRKKNIEKAISHLFPLAHHGCCIGILRNCCIGILRRLTIMIKSASSVVLFKRATTAYHVEEFKQLMGWIHLISTRCVSYLERASFTYWSIVHFVEDRHNIITNNNV